MFVFFLLTGRWLELRLRDKTAGALEAVMNRLPDAVHRKSKDGEWALTTLRHLSLHDVIQVRPGEAFAADANIVRGETQVDEALLTGESRPCGLLYSALMVAALTGNALEGALTMSCFALGSGLSLGFAPWLLLKLKTLGDGAWGIRLAGLALVVTSGWALWMGLAHNQAPWCVV
jgi:hypothetical protein